LLLITEARVPLLTRIQTLQLLSDFKLSLPANAEQCIEEADRLIDMLDPEQLQTRLLREENRNLQADMMAWRLEYNLVGEDINDINERGEALEQELTWRLLVPLTRRRASKAVQSHISLDTTGRHIRQARPSRLCQELGCSRAG
jgi:hypothetical protein